MVAMLLVSHVKWHMVDIKAELACKIEAWLLSAYSETRSFLAQKENRMTRKMKRRKINSTRQMANFPPSEKQKNGYKTNHKLEIQLQILSMPVMTYKKFKSS